MSDQEIIRSLVDAFSSLKCTSNYISLRFWYDGNVLKYFLTNTEQRSRKEQHPTQGGTSLQASTQESPPLTTRQTRSKRKKISSSTPLSSPEVHREVNVNDSSADVSCNSSENCRDKTEISIPCLNGFERKNI